MKWSNFDWNCEGRKAISDSTVVKLKTIEKRKQEPAPKYQMYNIQKSFVYGMHIKKYDLLFKKIHKG
jgi:hypothetical protein